MPPIDDLDSRHHVAPDRSASKLSHWKFRQRSRAMQTKVRVLSVVVAASMALAIGVSGQGSSPALQLVTRAADALGGRDRVMALKTLQIVGYGELAYFNGGGN